MKQIFQIAIALFVSINMSFGFNELNEPLSNVTIEYNEDNFEFNTSEKKLIEEIIINAEIDIRKLMPSLPQKITVKLSIMDRNLDIVGGTTGRTQKHKPNGEVYVYLSNLHPGGVQGAINASLKYLIYHEFHHLARGWAMEDNEYGPGISTAMVNEGLAVVFAEDYTQTILEGHAFPDYVDSWVKEIMELPKDANYNSWMNMHPDGRLGVGYKSGHYVIREALKNSKKTILELSELTPEEILKFAGY